jgi:diketogulonate reductase-like aldo/keto reductase
MEAIFASGRARSIGVSNFEKHHLEDILAMNASIPSVNQIEFHPYWHEDGLVEFCQAHKILVNAYSPLGAPDMSRQKGWDLTTERLLKDIGGHNNKTAAQVILQWEWQQGIIVNPRTNNTEHMTENLQFAGHDSSPFHLGHLDMELIRGLHHMNGKICPDPHDIP